LLLDGTPPVVGVTAVMLHIEERFAHTAADTALFPSGAANRAETRRLMDWVLFKLNDEVTRYILEEKVIKRDLGDPPQPAALRAAKVNLGEHLAYLSYLFATRRWLAGDAMTLADFALAAHLSSLDYLGDVPWEDAVEVRDWYQRVKSRPTFRPLLADRVAAIPAAPHYADLDF
ncbi:MAG TPA: glutathione S-transferase family protein, partial [Devosiaceae bacterium]|nr:glutathione S-transferase family protein [Devosiaceae bacterium]